ncbi:bifunctional phosphoribosyl-AMP cyclohydrolase/phosphoribosyl-ATP diphosphatase HisIE [Natranaerobius trueperi]|uniref:Histidine biosynthesis bifunctional protein HisIE n=1 Tax=Natranaerobius trueperi TaxID=759412 RepID=A0A226BXL5_9FIRM|nr:bifunctional phosphoribosyl-AMP cyclohydrolase/phosphoribosyl-ATP diphosphatase HisIE [Natranaerobius trueperi]OWZ83773.1 bifunctional phosphoribosyl-AMP cyclohydrolase/phosphoribosyl-ATP pyrophosphatase [Natranaerobius trueperi]
MINEKLLEEISFSEDGLLPCIVQDNNTNEVLMMAYMNKEALKKTYETGYTWFWSRKRQKLWQKGESSGNEQKVVSLQLDCDKDTLLAKVLQTGPACHTGEPTCFYNTLKESDLDKSYISIIPKLSKIVEERLTSKQSGSYTVKLVEKGENQVLKKLGEEATELVMACKESDKQEIKYEAADLMFHMILSLKYFEVDINEVLQELTNRNQSR